MWNSTDHNLPREGIPELNSSCCQGRLPILMSKPNVSSCNTIYFSSPTCGGEGKYLLLLCSYLLQIWKHVSPITLKQPPSSILSSLSLLFSGSPAAPHFPRSAVPMAGYHVPKKAFYYHVRKKDHIMYLTDCIPVHTFHNNIYFFFRNRMLLNHVQLVTGCKPKRNLLYNCYPSSLSCPVPYLLSWSLLLLKYKYTVVKSVAGFTGSHSNSFEFIRFIWNCNCLPLGQ